MVQSAQPSGRCPPACGRCPPPGRRPRCPRTLPAGLRTLPASPQSPRVFRRSRVTRPRRPMSCAGWTTFASKPLPAATWAYSPGCTVPGPCWTRILSGYDGSYPSDVGWWALIRSSATFRRQAGRPDGGVSGRRRGSRRRPCAALVSSVVTRPAPGRPDCVLNSPRSPGNTESPASYPADPPAS